MREKRKSKEFPQDTTQQMSRRMQINPTTRRSKLCTYARMRQSLFQGFAACAGGAVRWCTAAAAAAAVAAAAAARNVRVMISAGDKSRCLAYSPVPVIRERLTLFDPATPIEFAYFTSHATDIARLEIG